MMQQDEQDGYRPIKRIRQACQNCRRKKARCTGEKPECAFCVRLGQSCSYDDETELKSENGGRSHRRQDYAGSNGSDSEALSARMAALESQMTELTDTVQGLSNTLQSSLKELSKSISTGSTANGADDTSPQSTPYSRLPPLEIIRSAADLYFRYCHNQPYSLFHEQTFRTKLETGEVPTHLQFGLVASTVRYSNDPFFEDKIAAVSGYSQQSWKAIAMPWNGIQNDTELSIVQTILLLAIIDYTDGRPQSSWIKVGLAIRLAQDFRLMVEPDSELGPIQQEERRRVFWSFFLCDKLISCGRERPPVINDHQCKLQLPNDDNDWRAGHYSQTPTLDKLTDENADSLLHTLSPFAITIVITSLLGRCAQYALGEQEEQTPGGKALPWNPRSKYSSIHSALLQLESELGLNESLSRKITQHYSGSDGQVDQHRAAPLVLAHAIFFLCQCLLYHPFLIKQRLARCGQRTPQSFLNQSFNSCRAAASSLSRLMDDVKSLCCETLTPFYDPFYGYCTMVAGTIHVMFMNSSDPVVVEMANTSFESSMQNLRELSYYWKSCGMMRSRLEDFRPGSDRYATLVDPSVQEIHLSQDAANDLIECLDYSRMSNTPRRKSQNATNLATLSQLPSPFFEEFVNLLPLSYSRPLSAMPTEDMFAHLQSPPRGSLFDNHHFLDQDPTSDLYSNTTMPYNSNIGTSGMTNGNVVAPVQPVQSVTASSLDQSMNSISPAQAQETNGTMLSKTRSLTSPSTTMKRPWYEAT